jgi:YD repeat-containing protein
MKKLLIILLCSFVLLNYTNAQNIKSEFSFASPTVSGLTSEVLTPVSLSSGTVNIEIPLYQVKQGDITVPISLSYDASGVKVDAHPSWVGQNWTLKAGGMITRVTKSIPDETYVEEDIYLMESGNNHVTNYYPYGYIYNTDKLNNNSWNTISKITEWAKPSATFSELETDEFIFNFCGYSGKFYVDKNATFRIKGEKGFMIKALVYAGIPYYDNYVDYTYYYPYMLSGYIPGFVQLRDTKIMGFVITDPNGFKYYFGMYEQDEKDGLIDVFADTFDEIEINANFFYQLHEERFNTWYLTKIISPQGNEVSFEYLRGYPIAQFSNNYAVTKMSGSAPSSFWFGGHVSASNFSARAFLTGDLIRPTYLSKIITAQEEIIFNTSVSNELRYNHNTIHSHLYNIAQETFNPYVYIPVYVGLYPISYFYRNSYGQLVQGIDYTLLKWEKLNNISVKLKQSGQEIRKIEFSYRENPNDRLQLQTLREKADNLQKPTFVFTYNNSIKLPAYLSNSKDHWGYYNNKLPQLDPYSSASMSNYYNFREPDFTYTKAEILTKIQYPTGGYKEFEYEPHKYTKILKRNKNSGAISIETVSEKTGGGLRIKKIKENDGTTTITKNYEYNTGILNGEVQYYWQGYEGKLLNGNTYTADRFFSYSILPVSDNISGGNVSYSKVTEIEEENGKTEYVFSNHDSNIDENGVSIDPEKSAYSAFTSRELERGKLLEKIFYKEEETNPLKKEIYQYAKLNNADEYVPAVYVRNYNLFGGGEANAIEGSAYKIYVHPYNVTKKTEYFNSENLQIDNHFSYNSQNLLSSTSVLGSDGKKQTTKLVYPFEIIEGADTAVLHKMTEKNMLDNYIEKVSYLENGKVIDGEYRKFKETSGNSGIFKPEKIYLLPKTGSTTLGSLYPSSGKNIHLYLESGMHPPEIIRMTDTFTINKYPTKVAINMSLYQEPQYIGYFPISICFVISLRKLNGNNMYYIEAADNVYGRFANNMYYYDRTDTLELQAGTYVVELTHRGRFNSDFTYLNVGHAGSLDVTYSEHTPTMSSNYSLFKPEMSYKYDNKGNIIEAKHEGNQISTVYLWGYKYQYPIAAIKNATYVQVKAILGQTLIDRVANAAVPANADWDVINSLRNTAVFPNIEMTTYTYKLSIGIETITDPSGNKMTYEYDALGRLKRIRDADGNILENVEYHYNN